MTTTCEDMTASPCAVSARGMRLDARSGRSFVSRKVRVHLWSEPD